MMSALLEIIFRYGGWGILLVFVLYAALFPNRFDRFIAIVVQKPFAYLSTKVEKNQIKRDINSNLEIGRKRINKESEGSIPYELEIDFVDVDDPDISKSEDKLILKMKNHKNNSENLATCAYYYTKEGILPRAERYVDTEIKDSINYTIGKEVIKGDEVAIEFFQDYYDDRNEDFFDSVKKTEMIHDQGFLTRILLREYKKFNELYPKDPSNEVTKESREFFNLVYNIITKERGEKIDLEFHGNIIDAIIVPVHGEKGNIMKQYEFVKNACIKGNHSNYYFIASGHKVKSAKRLISLLENDDDLEPSKELYDTYKRKYKSNKKKILCCFMHVEEAN